MKRIVIALLVLMTIFSLANAQKQTTVINDSTGNVKVTVTKDKDAKTNAGNTAVTVVGMDDEDADTTHVSTSKASTACLPVHNCVVIVACSPCSCAGAERLVRCTISTRISR